MLVNKQQFNADDIYFSSDFHLNHKNICRGTTQWTSGFRDFDTVADMNSAILQSVNETVPEDKILFLLGDFNFGDKSQTIALREEINCRNIHLIYGNHDEHIRRSPEFQACFLSCQDFAEIVVVDGNYKKMISLFHYPMKIWNKAHRGAYALTGHSHGSLPYNDGELGLDMGWDVWKRPLGFREVQEILGKRQFVSIDHHNSDTN